MQLNQYNTFPATLPVIVEDDLFLYPFMISPIFLSDKEDIAAAQKAIDESSLILISSRKQNASSEVQFSNIYDSGVIGSIMRKVSLPDGRVKVLFQGLSKGKIIKEISDNPLLAEVDIINTSYESDAKMDALLEIIKEKVKALSEISNYFPADLLKTINDNNDLDRIADLISSAIKLSKDTAYDIFIQTNLENKFLALIEHITEEAEANKLQKEIRTKAHTKIEKVNKDYFLKEQMKQIQKELGQDGQRDEEVAEYKEKLENKKNKMKEDTYKEISKQLDRFARVHPDSSDANMIQSYLDWTLDIPFGKFSKKRLHISEVQKHLEKDHYSLEKPKERIVEYFAVKELIEQRGLSKKISAKGAILCFNGPPGVGKTSLANSIAKSLKRPLIRIALGGLSDVNELRGHRRTYVGAMPGRIVQGIIEAKVMNPVIVLDEIDKISRTNSGDPTAVLLEILDPEQNSAFRDYYTNFNLDLSNAIFIATANDVRAIPPALRDRMEFVNVSSYTPQEKYEIAKRYLLPQEIKKHGLKKSELQLNKSALKKVINSYTREAGVRGLRRKMADLSRKVAKELLLNPETKQVEITTKDLKKYLDHTVFEIEKTDGIPVLGIVNGLAWTAVGGDVLQVEVSKLQGKGALQITGSLGDVMKESTRIAFSVVKGLIDNKKLIIDKKLIPHTAKEEEEKTKVSISEVYKRFDLHIHFPDGATPKDGPSAGIAISTVISSILSDRKIRSDVAMTGEVSLKGKVMPIGGLKEKMIAAHRAGMKTVIIPIKNYERDLNDIPDEVKNDLKIMPVKRIEEVLKIALVD